ncbi:MAG: hypothetical protein KDB03_24900 [Planctomycetales bacterium]|nr:hypothetical protein [Planctomycetales bacterium]
MRFDSLSILSPVVGLLAVALAAASASQIDGQEPTINASAPTKQGFLVDVTLPLIGSRDEQVRQQIDRVASQQKAVADRPVVVLRFLQRPRTDNSGQEEGQTAGTQFERALALARYLTSPAVSRVRIIGYVPDSVQGHAILPLLACEDLYVAPDAELGNASVDEPVDGTIEGAYEDVVSRRGVLPAAIVAAMLKPNTRIVRLSLDDGTTLVSEDAQAAGLRDEGKVLREEMIWPGGGMASFNGQQLRAQRWIAGTATDVRDLAEQLGLAASLRTPIAFPKQWKGITISLMGKLNSAKVNQLVRGIESSTRDQETNLIVVKIDGLEASFDDAVRLASYLAELQTDRIFTMGLIVSPCQGPAGLIAIACDETILLQGASLAPPSENQPNTNSRKRTLVVENLAESSQRPVSLIAKLVDRDVELREFIHQGTGEHQLFAPWELNRHADAADWLAKQTVDIAGEIPPDLALQYRLIDAAEASEGLALSRIGLDAAPSEMRTPWLDASIQMLVAQSWIPRILLMVGLMALMAELSNPGIGAGAFISGLCFLGFFWIEGLAGNVEWLEVLLFIAGLIALAIEIFVVPGFGLFGIGGLVMLLVSVVLASQTFVWPTTSAQLSEVSVNLFWVACLAMVGMIGLLFMHQQLERLPMFRWVALRPVREDEQEELEQREAIVHWEHLDGQVGLTTTRLNPAGKAQFGDSIVAVVGTGGLIDPGVAVRVVEVRGNLVLVEPASA